MGGSNGGGVFNLSPQSMLTMRMEAGFHMKPGRVRDLAEELGNSGGSIQSVRNAIEGASMPTYAFGIIGAGLQGAYSEVQKKAAEALKDAEGVLTNWKDNLTRAADSVERAEEESSPDPTNTPPFDPSKLGGGGMPKFDPSGFDPNGLNPGGLDPNGLDPNGLDPNGLDPNGLDPNGLDPNGLDPNGLDPNGLDPNGLDPNGLDPNGLDPNGLKPNGLDPNLSGVGDPTNTSLANAAPTDLRSLVDPRLVDPNALGNTGTGLRNSIGTPMGGGSGGGIGGPGGGLGGLGNAARGLGANGMPFMPFAPMGGASAGGDKDRERERGASLSEDESTWLGDEEVAPPVIGMEEDR